MRCMWTKSVWIPKDRPCCEFVNNDIMGLTPGFGSQDPARGENVTVRTLACGAELGVRFSRIWVIGLCPVTQTTGYLQVVVAQVQGRQRVERAPHVAAQRQFAG